MARVSGLVSLISLCIVLIRTKIFWKNKSREAPEPAGAWPIIGHLHLLGGADQLVHRSLGAMADRYGLAFTIRLGRHRAFVIASRELAMECFTTKDRIFASRPATTATKHLCYNDAVFGFAPHSPYWREMRKIVVSELLLNRRLEFFKHVLSCEVEIGIRKLYGLWAENSCLPVLVDLSQWFNDLILNVTVRMIAGRRCSDALPDSADSEANRCQKAVSSFFHLMGIFLPSDALPFLGWLDLGGHERAMKKTARDLDAIFGAWLDEHQQKRFSREVKAEGEQDVIDILLSLKEEGRLSGLPFDEDIVIKSTCLSLLSGGGDATSISLIWAVSLLMNNRPMLKKAQEELDLHVGIERQVDESDIKNLKYLQAVMKETFRLYPVVPLSGPREALEDCNVAGYRVPAGTRLIVNIWKIHRDPNIWAHPLVFQPERFLTSHVDVDVKGKHYELLPFGAGRRSCPGSTFALESLHLTMARLLHAFDIATPMDQLIDMTEAPGILLPKASPLKVVLSPRLPAKLYDC